MRKISVLIPCYNESKTIGKVVEDFKRELPEAKIYVYDNNSSDGTDKLIRGDWKGEYTPFITGKNHGRMPNAKLFEYMGTLLKESKTGSVTPKMYSEGLTNDIASMLIDNRVDDDVTFAFVNTNIKGPTLKVTDMVEAIRQEKMKHSRNEGNKAKENGTQK